MAWIGPFLRSLFSVPDPPSIQALRRFSEELAAAATDLRAVALRSATLQARADELSGEVKDWGRRVVRAQRLGDHELIVACARMAGRVEGELQASRAELTGKLDEEIALRGALIDERRRWLALIEQGERMGLDVSSCLLHIDLTRPDPGDPDLPEDEEREFVARVIDGAALH